jgi:hypothetical protein
MADSLERTTYSAIRQALRTQKTSPTFARDMKRVENTDKTTTVQQAIALIIRACWTGNVSSAVHDAHDVA